MIRDGGILHPYRYNVDFYSRYPATNLPYGPPVLAVVFAAAFWLFGVSFTVTRAVICLYTVAAALMLHHLVVSVTRRYIMGLFAVAVFLANPIVAICARDIGPEMAVAFHSFLTLHLFLRYVEDDRRFFGCLSAVSLGIGYLSKQYIIPLGLALPLYVLVRERWDLLRRPETWIAALIAVTLTVPYTLLSLKFSNEELGLKMSPPIDAELLMGYPRLMAQHLPVLLLLGVSGMVLGVWRRHQLLTVCGLWALCWYGFNTFTMGYVIHERYLLSFVMALIFPAVAAAAEVTACLRRIQGQRLWIATLVIWLGSEAAGAPIYFVRGYEAAGRFVAGQAGHGKSVLFYGTYDGSFMMGLREQLPEQGPRVLRGDRQLAVRLWFDDTPQEVLVSSPEDIVRLLDNHQTAYLVVERDLPGTKNDYPEYQLLLQTVAQDPRFRELKRFPLDDDCWCHAGSELVVYQFDIGKPNDDGGTVRIVIPTLPQHLEVQY